MWLDELMSKLMCLMNDCLSVLLCFFSMAISSEFSVPILDFFDSEHFAACCLLSFKVLTSFSFSLCKELIF